jgi:hypothetical protein
VRSGGRVVLEGSSRDETGRFLPQGEYVHVDFDHSARHITVAQYCRASAPTKITGTVRSNDTFAVSGTGLAGHVTAKSRFTGASSEHHLTDVNVTITSGRGQGVKTWQGHTV